MVRTQTSTTGSGRAAGRSTSSISRDFPPHATSRSFALKAPPPSASYEQNTSSGSNSQPSPPYAMLEQDQNDLSDDSDYAASQQQGLGRSTLRNDPSGSDGSDAGAEVLYSRENVAIHPTQFSSERITGRLLLSKQGDSLFMSWIPYKPSSSGMDSAWYGDNCSLQEKDRSMYTIRDVSLADFHSIRRHTPAFGWQYIIVVLSSGLAFPPLYFYDGGVREFLVTIKQHAFIVRSADDANVFLVNNLQDPLQKTLSSLELHGVVPVGNKLLPSMSFNSSMVQDSNGVIGATQYDSSSVSEYGGRPSHKFHDPAHDLSIQVLEKFSLITKFARETTSQLFRENHSNSFSSYDKRQQIQAAQGDVPVATSTELEHDANNFPVDPDPLKYDQTSLVWGKPRKSPMGHEEWITHLDSEGRIKDSQALRKLIFYGGVQHGLRKEVWKFLLGHYAYDSTYAEREYLSSVKKSEYETIKSQWQSISSTQARRFTKFRERKGLIEKDVVRTDRSISFYEGDDNKNVEILHDILLTYSFYNFDLGYCQGMSDFLSPILFVIEDESESFWCFATLMERLGPNFNRDQIGMQTQLFALSKLVEILDLPLHNYLKQADCLNYYFCFRWILIQFKREFEYDQVMRLWEVLWTHYLSEHLHLYVCVAILKKYRQKIMGERMDFDTLLKFINGLSCSIELDGIIRDAEALCNCAGENGAACIPPGTPPSLPVESTLQYQPDDEDDFGKAGCI